MLEFIAYISLMFLFIGLVALLTFALVVVLCVIAHYFPKTRPFIKRIVNPDMRVEY